MTALCLSVLLLCWVTPFMARACTILPQSDGLHVQCRQPSLTPLPHLSPHDVVWLDLRHSHLTQLPDFEPQFLARVHHLDVSHNVVTRLGRKDLLGAHELSSLDVSYNRLRVLREASFGNLSALNTLILHHNQLTWLAEDAFLGLPHLLTLNLRSNNLTRLSSGMFHGLRHLTSLDLSDNRLETLANNTFKDLISLRYLTVSGNDLHRLEPLAFVGLSLLTEINLDHSQLQFTHVSLQPGIFAPLHSVEIFSLVDTGDVSSDEYPKSVFNDLVSVRTLSIDLFFDLQFDRSSLDTLASYHPIRLSLQGNPLSCACANLDFLQWLWDTKVTLDGEDSSTRRYTCTSDTGEFTDTERVMAEWQSLWRRCVGLKVFGWTMTAFFVQMLSLLTVFMISRSWTHLKYAWNVLRRLPMPTRHDFRKDVYMAYADADAALACLRIPRCLRGHDIRFLLRHQEELPGSIMADNTAMFIEDSWKVMLLVTQSFAQDDWSCGFTVHQAQRSITDTLPNRVLVVFLEDPRHLPPMASLERLLRHYPEPNVFHVPRETPVNSPVWEQLAQAVLR
ncbi:hypothetical protein ACOMHN_021690 [Nucella lapillus]